MRKLAEGAEADVYEGSFIGMDVIVKRRRRKPYIAAELEEDLRLRRTKNEARIIGVASERGISVPPVLMVGLDAIYMGRVDGEPLSSYIAHAGRGARQRIFASAGAALMEMHRLGIAHGDYTPANMLVDRARRLWIIDFGLAAQSASTEDKALDVLLLKRAVSAIDYDAFVKAYSRHNGAAQVLRKLADIERRGRYQARSLAESEEPQGSD
ncbi:Kae1-associated serine/threonine protein kinase [Candidatus Marsarchaeota archaeon]|jgi:Kae1-associated kinase Bud32|nr:Kae1-associated serine/threonine protein kinase [Candidatus Marsarchaeota archaeon]MCL5100194.1 Kae1-associated serine/threonine protein kinase [Candidatus Marsarchaeota archaeon]